MNTGKVIMTLIVSVLLISSITADPVKLKHRKQDQKIHFSYGTTQNNRDIVTDVISSIDQVRIEQLVQDLVDFETRYYEADNRYEVANWLYNEFIESGLASENVEIDSFFFDNGWHRNVYGIIPGTMYPDKYVLISGHYDSISETPMTYAPGADDNASSIAAILEAARAMTANNFEPDVSIMFTLFGSKEPGRYGSEYLVNKFIEEDTDLLYAINLELLGYSTVSPEDWLISFNRYTGSEFLYNFILDTMADFTTLNAGLTVNNFNYYDCWNFYQNNFNVVMFTAEEFNTSAHYSGDVIDNLDFTYMTELNKLACAAVVELSLKPLTVNDIAVYDDGTGNGLFLTWSPSNDTDFDHFEVAYGTESGDYDNLLTTSGTEILLYDLTEGQNYFIGVTAVDSDGNKGFYIENEEVPLSLPRIPANFAATPQWTGVELSWIHNNEMDINGYNIFRSEDPEANFEQINQEPIIGTEFLDAETSNGVFYFYKIKAIDFSGNESDFSEVIRSRIISLDEGILLIDDTMNGNGNFMQPEDTECDMFYENLLHGFSFENIDTEDIEKVNLDDMCAYSLVIWYIDDNVDQSNISDSYADIQRYLDEGGNLFLSGYRVISKLCDLTSFPTEFQEGDLARDFLKIVSTDFLTSGRFNEAIDENGINVPVDPEKIPEAMNAHLFGIEVLTPSEEGDHNFIYGTGYDPETPFGIMAGLPVNTTYSGDDHKVLVQTFPLYYMLEEAASEMMYTVLTEFFNEETSLEDNSIPDLPDASLNQNYPNPFNPVTTISFNLSPEKSENALIEIFNVKGQLVRSFSLSAIENSIVWKGKDEQGSAVSSGIYFYNLNCDGKVLDSRKMLLLK
ncbi:M20/M25/M40 family metallo-hydrolase [Candidatus Cloacimonadota bacterium]